MPEEYSVSSSSTPPAKGTTIVVSIPAEDVGCSKPDAQRWRLQSSGILAVPSAPKGRANKLNAK
jgi:hypothetical protein